MSLRIQGGGNIVESFCPKISDILANSEILGTPFVLRAYIAGIFLPKNFGHIGKFGNIGPEIFAPLYYFQVDILIK
jgi:hypothetical protein